MVDSSAQQQISNLLVQLSSTQDPVAQAQLQEQIQSLQNQVIQTPVTTVVTPEPIPTPTPTPDPTPSPTPIITPEGVTPEGQYIDGEWVPYEPIIPVAPVTPEPKPTPTPTITPEGVTSEGQYVDGEWVPNKVPITPSVTPEPAPTPTPTPTPPPIISGGQDNNVYRDKIESDNVWLQSLNLTPEQIANIVGIIEDGKGGKSYVYASGVMISGFNANQTIPDVGVTRKLNDGTVQVWSGNAWIPRDNAVKAGITVKDNLVQVEYRDASGKLTTKIVDISTADIVTGKIDSAEIANTTILSNPPIGTDIGLVELVNSGASYSEILKYLQDHPEANYGPYQGIVKDIIYSELGQLSTLSPEQQFQAQIKAGFNQPTDIPIYTRDADSKITGLTGAISLDKLQDVPEKYIDILRSTNSIDAMNEALKTDREAVIKILTDNDLGTEATGFNIGEAFDKGLITEEQAQLLYAKEYVTQVKETYTELKEAMERVNIALISNMLPDEKDLEILRTSGIDSNKYVDNVTQNISEMIELRRAMERINNAIINNQMVDFKDEDILKAAGIDVEKFRTDIQGNIELQQAMDNINVAILSNVLPDDRDLAVLEKAGIDFNKYIDSATININNSIELQRAISRVDTAIQDGQDIDINDIKIMANNGIDTTEYISSLTNRVNEYNATLNKFMTDLSDSGESLKKYGMTGEQITALVSIRDTNLKSTNALNEGVKSGLFTLNNDGSYNINLLGSSGGLLDIGLVKQAFPDMSQDEFNKLLTNYVLVNMQTWKDNSDEQATRQRFINAGLTDIQWFDSVEKAREINDKGANAISTIKSLLSAWTPNLSLEDLKNSFIAQGFTAKDWEDYYNSASIVYSFEQNIKNAPLDLQGGYTIGGIEGYQKVLDTNYTLLPKNEATGDKGQYISNETLRNIETVNPVLYNIMTTEGYNAYRQAVDDAQKEIAQYGKVLAGPPSPEQTVFVNDKGQNVVITGEVLNRYLVENNISDEAFKNVAVLGLGDTNAIKQYAQNTVDSLSNIDSILNTDVISFTDMSALQNAMRLNGISFPILMEYENRDDFYKAFVSNWNSLTKEQKIAVSQTYDADKFRANPFAEFINTIGAISRDNLAAQIFYAPVLAYGIPIAKGLTKQEITPMDYANAAIMTILLAAPVIGSLGKIGYIASKVALGGTGLFTTAQTIKNWTQMNNVERAVSVAFDALILAGALPNSVYSNAVKLAKNLNKDQRGSIVIGKPSTIIDILKTERVLTPQEEISIVQDLSIIQEAVANRSPFQLLDAARNLKRNPLSREFRVLNNIADNIMNNPNGFIDKVNVDVSKAISDNTVVPKLELANDIVKQVKTNQVELKGIPEGMTESQFQRFLKTRVLEDITPEEFMARENSVGDSLIKEIQSKSQINADWRSGKVGAGYGDKTSLELVQAVLDDKKPVAIITNDTIGGNLEEAIAYAKRNGLKVEFITKETGYIDAQEGFYVYKDNIIGNNLVKELKSLTKPIDMINEGITAGKALGYSDNDIAAWIKRQLDLGYITENDIRINAPKWYDAVLRPDNTLIKQVNVSLKNKLNVDDLDNLVKEFGGEDVYAAPDILYNRRAIEEAKILQDITEAEYNQRIAFQQALNDIRTSKLEEQLLDIENTKIDINIDEEAIRITSLEFIADTLGIPAYEVGKIRNIDDFSEVLAKSLILNPKKFSEYLSGLSPADRAFIVNLLPSDLVNSVINKEDNDSLARSMLNIIKNDADLTKLNKEQISLSDATYTKPLSELQTVTETEIKVEPFTETVARTLPVTETEIKTKPITETVLDTKLITETETEILPQEITTVTYKTGETSDEGEKQKKKLSLDLDSMTPSERRKKEFEGALGWKQGFGWWFIKSPYRTNKDIAFFKTPPKGATIVEGAKAAYKSIQQLTGKPPARELKIPIGIVTVTISKPESKAGAKGAIKYKMNRAAKRGKDTGFVRIIS